MTECSLGLSQSVPPPQDCQVGVSVASSMIQVLCDKILPDPDRSLLILPSRLTPSDLLDSYSIVKPYKTSKQTLLKKQSGILSKPKTRTMFRKAKLRSNLNPKLETINPKLHSLGLDSQTARCSETARVDCTHIASSMMAN